MSGVRACAAALLRRRWAGVIALALLVGLGGGAVLASAAGARRTSSAASRLYARGAVADVEVDPPNSSSGTDPGDVAALRRLPEVRHATTADFFPGAALHGDRPPSGLNVFVAANRDGTWIYDFDRIGLLPSFRGRMPDPSRADEVVATASEARELHVSIGSSLRVAVAKFTDTGAAVRGSDHPARRRPGDDTPRLVPRRLVLRDVLLRHSGLRPSVRRPLGGRGAVRAAAPSRPARRVRARSPFGAARSGLLLPGRPR